MSRLWIGFEQNFLHFALTQVEYTWTTLICLSRIRNRGHSFRTKVVVVEDLVLHRFYWAIFKSVCCCISNNPTISFEQKFEKLLVWHLLVTIKTKRFFLCSFSVVPNSWSANNKQNVTLWFLLCLIIAHLLWISGRKWSSP